MNKRRRKKRRGRLIGTQRGLNAVVRVCDSNALKQPDKRDQWNAYANLAAAAYVMIGVEIAKIDKTLEQPANNLPVRENGDERGQV